MSAPNKPKYRTTNSKECKAALKARGSLLLWLGQDMCWQGSAKRERSYSHSTHYLLGHSDEGLRMPKTILQAANLRVGDEVGCRLLDNGMILLTPRKEVRNKKRYPSDHSDAGCFDEVVSK